MKTRFIFVVILFIVAQLLIAQKETAHTGGGAARTSAIGGNPNNPYVEDYTDVFYNPAYTVKYSNLVYVDFGHAFTKYSASGQYFGVALSVAEGFSFGLSVGKHEGPVFPDNSYGYPPTFTYSDNMKDALQDYMSRKSISGTVDLVQPPFELRIALASDEFDIGFAFLRSGKSYRDEYPATTGQNAPTVILDRSMGQTGFKLGVVKRFEEEVSLDLGLLLRFNNAFLEYINNQTTTNNKKFDAKGTEIGATSRMQIPMSDVTSLVPLVRFYTFSYTPEETSGQDPAPNPNTKPNEYGRTEFEAGAGINTKFEGGFVTVGLSFQSISLKHNITSRLVPTGSTQYELKTTNYSARWSDLPKINLGVEYQILNWLIGRAGYFKRISTLTVTTEPWDGTPKSETKQGQEPAYMPSYGMSAADQQFTIGLGIYTNGFSLDGYVGERMLVYGPYIISGSTMELFGALAMSFKF